MPAPTPTAQPTSLIRYDNPVLVSRSDRTNSLKQNLTASSPSSPTKQTLNSGNRVGNPIKQKLPPVDDRSGKKSSVTQGDDILSSILPPREWEENGELWIQKISSAPSTRLDVLNLQEQLDAALQAQQARETGICPIRRELYAQVFDELIRQVTISCQERGLLLLRVRDEISMTMTAYQILYESSIAFGMRKALMAEWGKSEMENSMKKLEDDKKQLEQQVLELRAKCESIEKREADRRIMEERKHTEEISFLKKTNMQLKSQLEGILNLQKKQ
ncbi:axonemal dynein light chain-domain-containing protein [Paraphysoderma sedebokerense]|nr:axonemal dynein light chain-domain-containing protein [Paraphysoderma sedebokerense]